MEAKDKTNKEIYSVTAKVLSALLMYICLLIFHGYIFGYEDQIEIVPVLYQMDHPEIYQNDYFIQNVLRKPVHERWFFIHTIHFFNLFGQWSFFLMHGFFSFLLILGLNKIAGIVIRAQVLRWLAIFMVLLVTYNINLGGNELYYNTLIPSIVAKAIAVWGIYFSWKMKWVWMIPLFVIVTYIQPLVGIQVILLCFLAGFQMSWDSITGHFKTVFWPYIVVLVLILPWLYLLYSQHAEGDLSNELLFEIIEFRLPHHFSPLAFSKKGYLLLPLLSLIGIIVFRKKASFFARIIVWGIIGCLLYVLGVVWLKIPLVLDTQWFKTTIWIKAIGLIALFHLLEEWMRQRESRFPFIKKLDSRLLFWGVPVGMIFLILLLKYTPSGMVTDRPYDFPWGENMSPEKEISILAGELSKMDAVFLVPPSFTMFKWYSKRSSYVDYKAMIHHKDVMGEWYHRIQFVYGIDHATKQSGKDVNDLANENLKNMDSAMITAYKGREIDYIIGPKNSISMLKEIASNEKYAIYTLTLEEVD